MLDRIDNRPRCSEQPLQENRLATNTSSSTDRKSFAETLLGSTEQKETKTSVQRPALGQVVVKIEQQRREIDRLIEQAARGRAFSPRELLVLQAKVYSYSQSMDVISHLVERSVSAVKTTMNTQL